MTQATVVRMSERYWGLTWETFERDGFVATPVTFEECLPFMTQHYGKLFETQPDRFLEEKMTPAKLRFLAESDCFLFCVDNHDVGMCVLNPSDWSTQYIRTYALLPEARGHDFSLPFLRHVFDRLKSVGVKRIEADTAPTNFAVQKSLMALGMMVTSTTVSERWGLMLRMTGFLDEEADRAFRRQLLHVPGVPLGCPLNPPTKKGAAP